MNARFQFVLCFCAVTSVLLLTLLAGQVRTLRVEIRALNDQVATREDLVAAQAPEMRLLHEEKCTSCHTERRFAGEHNTRGEIDAAMVHMQAMPDAGFTDEDMAKIHASLTLLRCARCHAVEKLRGLSLRTPEERMDLIRTMMSKPGSGLTSDEADEINRAYQQVIGF
jgi:hypothetical protein